MATAITQSDILVLIYKTEYYIINKDYDQLLREEYGDDSCNNNSLVKIQCLRLLLKALKYQYNIDWEAAVSIRLYIKIKECIGLNLEIIPSIDTSLVIYGANGINETLYGSVILATYQELLGNLPEDYDKVISVKVFNEYFSNFDLSVRIYKNIINITNGLVITHNLNTPYINVQFYDTVGPIICEYNITNNNSITLVSNTTINSVHVVILG